jgi:peptide/nickel transport system permease protein
VNQALMRTTDAMIALPLIGVMFVLAKYLGPGVPTILIVLVMFGWMGTARLVAGEVLKLKGQDFVEAARAAGANDRRIIVRHLVPNSLYVTIVSATFLVGEAIQLESIISYFGLGIQPPTPSWGNMLQNAQEYLLSAPYLAVFPGAFIFITVLAFNFMGDGLRDALDPRLKL